jgi:hypothetical protein
VESTEQLNPIEHTGKIPTIRFAPEIVVPLIVTWLCCCFVWLIMQQKFDVPRSATLLRDLSNRDVCSDME